MTPKRRETFFSGFTLIELLISSVIFAVLALSIYSAFYAGIFGNRNISESAAQYRTAAQVLECLNTDLRNSFAYSGDESRFEGENAALRFLSIAETYRGNTPERDYAFISYKLEDGKLLRQCRLNAEALNNDSPAEFEEMASPVKQLVFSYGAMDIGGKNISWQQDWHVTAAIPAAVKIKLVLGDKNSREFERTIYVPMSK